MALSMVSRLFGFGLCVVGAFTLGFYQALHITAGNATPVINQLTASTPDFATAIADQVAKYIQQDIDPGWVSFSLVGIAVMIAGAVVVAIGDRKPAGKEGQGTKSQTVPIKR